jgi:hypothetical protein
MASTLNADNGVSSGSAGLKSTADSSGVLTLQTNGTNALSIDTAQASSFAANVSVTGNVTANKQIFNSAALGAASAGTAEYNGKALFFTPIGTQRGVVPGMQFFRLDGSLAGANVNTAQSVFGVGVTLSASTVYYFDGIYALSKSAGTTSHTTGIGFGGTATVNNIGYWAQGGTINTTSFVDTSAGQSFQYYIQTVNNTVLNGAQAAATTIRQYRVSGSVSVNAGGTFIPQYTLSAAPGGAYTTAAGSWFMIYPIGASGANVNVGTWA